MPGLVTITEGLCVLFQVLEHPKVYLFNSTQMSNPVWIQMDRSQLHWSKETQPAGRLRDESLHHLAVPLIILTPCRNREVLVSETRQGDRAAEGP